MGINLQAVASCAARRQENSRCLPHCAAVPSRLERADVVSTTPTFYLPVITFTSMMFVLFPCFCLPVKLQTLGPEVKHGH